MTIMLQEKLIPITFSIGFLNTSFPKVRDAFLQWEGQHYKSVVCKSVDLPIGKALEQLQPLSPIPRRWLLVPTAGDWVAYFDNCIRGSDPAPVVCYLSQRLACRGVVATSVPHTFSEEVGAKRGLYGAVQFELFAARGTDFLNCERSVSVAYEAGKWKFSANGTVQSFEDTGKYQSRRIADRFTSEMLEAYCKALRIEIGNESFYKSPSALIFSEDPLPVGWHTSTIAQAQDQMGVVKLK